MAATVTEAHNCCNNGFFTVFETCNRLFSLFLLYIKVNPLHFYTFANVCSQNFFLGFVNSGIISSLSDSFSPASIPVFG